MSFPDYPGAENHGIPAIGHASARSGTVIDRIVIHVAVGTYAGSLQWAEINPYRTSFHYITALNARIGQAVAEKWAAHHAGHWPTNLRSVGIEHEDKQRWRSSGWWTERQIKATAKLTAYLCRKYRIPADRKHIIAHNEVPGVSRPCPGPNFPWRKFMDYVRAELGAGAEKPPEPDGTLYRVQSGAFETRRYASRHADKTRAAGLETAVLFQEGMWKVQHGAFESYANAERREELLESKGFDAFKNIHEAGDEGKA